MTEPPSPSRSRPPTVSGRCPDRRGCAHDGSSAGPEVRNPRAILLPLATPVLIAPVIAPALGQDRRPCQGHRLHDLRGRSAPRRS